MTTKKVKGPKFPRFGDIPVPKSGGQYLVLKASEIAGVIRNVLPCASTDACRPNLSAVLLQWVAPRFRAVATDGHRLALADHMEESPNPPAPTPFSFLLDRSAAANLLALLTPLKESLVAISLVVARSNVGVGIEPSMEVTEVEFKSAVTVRYLAVRFKYPPYEGILKKLDCREGARVNAKYIRDALAPAAAEKDGAKQFVDVWMPASPMDPVVFARPDYCCVVMPARKQS